MRIISNFHDYYDCIQRYGQSDIVYLRNPKLVIEFPRSYTLWFHLWCARFPLAHECATIGFCGELYRVIKVSRGSHYGKKYETPVKYLFSLEELDAYVDTYCQKKEIAAYYADRSSWDRRYRNWVPIQRAEVKRFFDYECYTIGVSKDLFREHNVPIFIVTEEGVTINCCLKDWEFYQKFDTQAAFSEIEMYLGGVLGSPEKPIPQVDDKTMRDIKGFDDRSFKKEKKSV